LKPMKKLIFLLFFFCLFISIFSQENQELKKCVAFICIKTAKKDLVPIGTGFFVGVPDKSDPNKAYVFLVTAKHVVIDTNGKYYKEIYLRLNTKSGVSKEELIPMYIDGKPNFVIDSDKSIDIVVIPTLPDPDRFDFKFIPENMIATKDIVASENIREGDDVFFTGLFVNYYGRNKNYPIFRFGKVALLTDERIYFDKTLSYLYLLETTSFGGNSGSPVFFKLNPTRNPNNLIIGPQKYFLAGIMKGYFGAEFDTCEVNIKKTIKIPFQNTGIAAVTPAYQLKELLDSKSIMKMKKTK